MCRIRATKVFPNIDIYIYIYSFFYLVTNVSEADRREEPCRARVGQAVTAMFLVRQCSG